MARRAKRENSENAATGRGPSGGNGLDPRMTQGFLDRILNLYGSLDTERSDYMLACKDIRGDMALVYDEAKDKGVPKRALKSAVKKRLLELKIEGIREDLDGQDLDDYDMVLQALGDYSNTPLGAAALALHESAPVKHEGPVLVA